MEWSVKLERELIERAQKGDAGALGKLLRHFAPELRRHIASKTSARWQGKFSTDDVVQDTFVKVCSRIKSFNLEWNTSFCSWLCKLGEFTLLNTIRQLMRVKHGGQCKEISTVIGDDQGELLQLFNILSDGGISPSTHAFKREATIAVDAAISQLSMEQELAVRLKHFEGLTHEEIAHTLGKKQARTISKTLERAYANLRKALGRASLFFSGR